MMHLYQFTETRGHWTGSAPTVCIGPLSAVCVLIDRDEMAALFGGYVIYESGDGVGYIGVWGARKASRLRRMLRERGAVFRLLPGFPPGLRMKGTSVHYNSG